MWYWCCCNWLCGVCGGVCDGMCSGVGGVVCEGVDVSEGSCRME